MVIVLDCRLRDFPSKTEMYINMDKVRSVSSGDTTIEFHYVDGTTFMLHKNQQAKLFESVKRQVVFWSTRS